jgi:2-polyprenyl-6-methoxyphenol hydroxylase-like FAD-dependent oxidoreductase
MSDLLPNLDALLAQLTGATAGPRDARALAEAVAEARTDEDIDDALDAVIATWRKS